jgi:hypothetical protein
MKLLMDGEEPLLPFRYRGLSDRTIKALLESGMDLPERLLGMNVYELKRMKGIGAVAVREIAQY